MEYFTATSYKNWERIGKPYKNDKGNLVTKVKCECPRCGGKGIIVARVENDRLIPIPVDGGICYNCRGAKYITKEVRLYTESEFNSMEKAKEKTKERKQNELEKKMQAEFEQNKKKWFADNGFSEDGYTYIITGDSYAIKDELKAKGYIYNPILRWHKATIDEEYAGRSLQVALDSVCELSAWGKGVFKAEAKTYIDSLLEEVTPPSRSEWVGEVGGKLKDLTVDLVKKIPFDGVYGLSYILTFVDEAGNKYNWFTSTFVGAEVGDRVKIKSAGIKKHDEYKGEKVTVITRAKLN